MKIGQIQAAALTSGGLSLIFKEIDVLQVPFLYQKYEEVDFVLKKMDSFFRKGFEDNGYVLLGWSEAGFIYLMSTLPITSVAELKKMKVWVWEESPMAKAIFDVQACFHGMGIEGIHDKRHPFPDQAFTNNLCSVKLHYLTSLSGEHCPAAGRSYLLGVAFQIARFYLWFKFSWCKIVCRPVMNWF
jgi:hypothetical protein